MFGGGKRVLLGYAAKVALDIFNKLGYYSDRHIYIIYQKGNAENYANEVKQCQFQPGAS